MVINLGLGLEIFLTLFFMVQKNMNKNTQIEVYKMDGKWVVLANKKVLDIFPTKKKAMEYVAQIKR